MSAVPKNEQVAQREIAVPADASSLMKIIDRVAMDPNFDVAKLEQLLAVKERWEANEAKKAFVTALAAFKANPPTITKNRHVSFETQKGKTEYDHATLDHVSKEIGLALHPHGLSHRWSVEQIEGGMVRVGCLLTHVLGHSETVFMQAGLDQSGSKNNIQALGSTVTYLQRYTLLAATGMAVQGQDNDGATVNGNGKKLDDDTYASYIKAIDNAKDEAELKSEYKAAYRSAEGVGDTHAIKKFEEHKNARKKTLGVKA